jgi:hypothetical protein
MAVERLKKIDEIAARYAVPWYRKLGLASSAPVPTSEKWYTSY